MWAGFAFAEEDDLLRGLSSSWDMLRSKGVVWKAFLCVLTTCLRAVCDRSSCRSRALFSATRRSSFFLDCTTLCSAASTMSTKIC